MTCCVNEMTEAEHDKAHAGQCPACGQDIDAEGDTVMLDNCCYSPTECEKCGYSPCDGSC